MKVLIIKMGALGDVIMSTPLIRRIMEHHVDASIWLLTSPGFIPLFQGWPRLSIQSFPRKGALAMLQTLLWLRSNRFDRMYDLQSSERTAMLCALSGIPERAGNHPGLAYTMHPHDRYTGQYHAQERLNQILVSAGVAPCYDPPYLPISDDAKARVCQWLKSNGLADRRFVLMHAGASSKHPQKRWPYFLELAQGLKTYGLDTLWLGGKDDETINTSLSAHTGINTSGIFNVQEEAELGRHARFAVTNDSAPMHILSCSGIPVFGLFGPTNWRRTHAIGQQANIIVTDADTNANQLPAIKPDLRQIPVSQVMEKLNTTGLLKHT